MSESGLKQRPFSLALRENRLFFLILAGGLFLALALALPLFRGTVYEFDDLNNYHLPFRYFYSQCLRSGDTFTWIPNIFCGFYLHGEGQVGMLHPFHLLLYKTLPLNVAYNLELILSYPFMLAGMFFFLRRWKLPRDASMLGAVLFAFSGFNILHYVHMNAVAVAAHIPWLLIVIDMIARDHGNRKRAVAALALTLLTASQLLLGHPSTFWLSSVVELLYALFLISPWRNLRAYITLGAAKTLGALIGAVQLLPHWEAASDSMRQHPHLESLLWPSVHPLHLLQMVAPYFYNEYALDGLGYDVKTYTGAIPLALLVLLLIRRKHLGRWKGLATAVVVLSLLSLPLAMGKYGYLFLLQTYLPLVGLLRTPCRYVLLFHFSLAVGAAIAFADISSPVERSFRSGWRALVPLLILPAAAGLPFLMMLVARVHNDPTLAKYFVYGVNPQWNMVIAGPALFLLATTLTIVAARGKQYALLGIALLACGELFLYGVNFMGSGGTRTIDEIVDSFPTPAEDPRLYRIQSEDNIFIMKNARLAGGYASIRPKKKLNMYDPARLRLANAHSLLAKNTLLFGGRAYGMRLPEPLPRARLVSRAVVSLEPNEDINAVDVASTALVEHDVQLAGGPPGNATLVVDRPGAISIATESGSRQLLVLSESYHDGWQANVDGEPAPVLRLYGDFMGCVVEPGKHMVTFSFRPKSLVVGARISLMGIGLAVLSFLFSLFGKRIAPALAHSADEESYCRRDRAEEITVRRRD
jgi:hypothetical protein